MLVNLSADKTGELFTSSVIHISIDSYLGNWLTTELLTKIPTVSMDRHYKSYVSNNSGLGTFTTWKSYLDEDKFNPKWQLDPFI